LFVFGLGLGFFSVFFWGVFFWFFVLFFASFFLKKITKFPFGADEVCASTGMESGNCHSQRKGGTGTGGESSGRRAACRNSVFVAFPATTRAARFVSAFPATASVVRCAVTATATAAARGAQGLAMFAHNYL
jgi:hypothetical protein